jgi:hypothetical protein
MSDKSFLCVCAFCLNENAKGVLLNKNTFNRHRSRIQEYSVRDENLEDVRPEMERSMPLDTEEDMILDTEENMQLQAENDIYHQEDNLDLIDNDSDTEIIDFNEEDGEHYSDYDDDDEIDEDDDEDDDDNNDDDDDAAMHVSDDKTNIPIEGLKLLHLKSLYNFTESAYDDIMKIFITNNISLYKVKTYLKKITGLIPVFYDMCENSCICYTGQYGSYQSCPICDSTRLDAKGKAKKVMTCETQKRNNLITKCINFFLM